LVLIFDL